jgi:hypothetical protein
MAEELPDNEDWRSFAEPARGLGHFLAGNICNISMCAACTVKISRLNQPPGQRLLIQDLHQVPAKKCPKPLAGSAKLRQSGHIPVSTERIDQALTD